MSLVWNEIRCTIVRQAQLDCPVMKLHTYNGERHTPFTGLKLNLHVSWLARCQQNKYIIGYIKYTGGCVFV